MNKKFNANFPFHQQGWPQKGKQPFVYDNSSDEHVTYLFTAALLAYADGVGRGTDEQLKLREDLGTT